MSKGDKVTAYVTKYALTDGIQTVSAKVISDTMIEHSNEGCSWISSNYVHKPFWHLTEEAAIAHAEEMRRKKIISLSASLKRMKELKITIVEPK